MLRCQYWRKEVSTTKNIVLSNGERGAKERHLQTMGTSLKGWKPHAFPHILYLRWYSLQDDAILWIQKLLRSQWYKCRTFIGFNKNKNVSCTWVLVINVYLDILNTKSQTNTYSHCSQILLFQNTSRREWSFNK